MPSHTSDEAELKVVWQYQIDQLFKGPDRLNRHFSRPEYHHEKRYIKDALGETFSLCKKYDHP